MVVEFIYARYHYMNKSSPKLVLWNGEEQIMIFANYHTHTTFCDGRDTPEQIVQEAIRLGCPAIGFSGHSVAPYDYAGMTPEHEAQYRAEVHRLQAAYAGQIQILCGVEQDYWSDAATDGYDYVIGGVHYLRHGNEFRSVDGTPDILRSIVNDWYGGDWYAMAEEYYGLIGNLYEKTRCRVIAHFDLIEKFNEDGALFDRNDPRYRAAALGALERLRSAPVIFEINTGAISRGWRTTPYPAPWILQEIRARGGQIMINSDSHAADTITCAFADALKLALDCGFTRVKIITESCRRWDCSMEGFVEWTFEGGLNSGYAGRSRREPDPLSIRHV